MKVYRLESSAMPGAGIFKAGIACSLSAIARDQIYEHPGPLSDHGLRDWWEAQDGITLEGYRFACVSLEQLRSTFRGDVVLWRELADWGAVLAVYEVDEDDVVRGAWQCVFRWDEAALVEHRSVLTIQ